MTGATRRVFNNRVETTYGDPVREDFCCFGYFGFFGCLSFFGLVGCFGCFGFFGFLLARFDKTGSKQSVNSAAITSDSDRGSKDYSSGSAETSGSGDSDRGSRFNSSGSAATSGIGDSDRAAAQG